MYWDWCCVRVSLCACACVWCACTCAWCACTCACASSSCACGLYVCVCMFVYVYVYVYVFVRVFMCECASMWFARLCGYVLCVWERVCGCLFFPMDVPVDTLWSYKLEKQVCNKLWPGLIVAKTTCQSERLFSLEGLNAKALFLGMQFGNRLPEGVRSRDACVARPPLMKYSSDQKPDESNPHDDRASLRTAFLCRRDVKSWGIESNIKSWKPRVWCLSTSVC